jgi:pilus assembly protein CpaE
MAEQTQSQASSRGQAEWKPLVVCPNSALAARTRSALVEQGCGEPAIATQYPRAGELPRYMSANGCNICFLDVSSTPAQALELVAEAAAVAPVVALNPSNDADLILRCLRAGAREFLSDPSAEQVRGVMDRLVRSVAPTAPRKAGKVVCVLPGKPGCGASTVAAYLSVDLKRNGLGKVLLVDVDLITASLAFFFKLKSDFHVGDAVRDWSRMDDDLWSRLTVGYQGVDVLLAPQNPTTQVEIDRQAARELLTFWRGRYEAVVLDLPGPNAVGFWFAALADDVLLVTTNELAALHATKRSIECLEKIGVDKARLKLIITRYLPANGLKREDVQNALKMEAWGLLANDYEGVQVALLEGKPVTPASQFGRGIGTLSRRLQGKPEAPRKRSGFFGLLSSRN